MMSHIFDLNDICCKKTKVNSSFATYLPGEINLSNSSHFLGIWNETV